LFSGNPGPVMRQKAKGTRPLRNKMRALVRRKAYAGFPISPRPFTADEVDAYFSGDTITCLLCGRGLRRLASHLPAIHQVSEDDYRKMYGLPWSRGLTSADSRARYSASVKAKIDAGLMPQLGRQDMSVLITAPRRPRQPFHNEKTVAIERAVVNAPVYDDTHFFAILARLIQGEKFPLKDLPGATWFHRWLRIYPERKRDMAQAIDALPFPAQAALGYGMGERFTEAVRLARASGGSDKSIAAALGVTAMTVWNRRKVAGIP
jgi:hypothetical protein